MSQGVYSMMESGRAVLNKCELVKAMAYYDVPAEKKITLVWKVAHLETLNGVTKAELQSMLKWVIERFYYCAEED